MTDSAFNIGNRQPAGPSGWDAGTAGTAAGQQEFRAAKDGEAGTARNTQSMLQDAAEEMTFGAAERTNKRDLGERQVRGPEGSRQIERIEQLQEMMQKLPDVDVQKIRAKIEQMRLHRDFSQQALEEWVGGFHEDITYQQAALELMASDLEKSGDDGALLDAVQGLIVKNEREFGPQIRAGANVTPVAMALAESSAEVQSLRDLYRDSVIAFDSANRTCRNIVERYGGEQLEDKIAFLLKGLGDDLGSRGPSVEPAELHKIVSELQSLKMIGTAYDRVAESMVRLQARHQVM
ncbi:MAG TPA: type III secretion system gatekeeper subunit SctW [Geminicoccaceae bacterium]|nr:type III secretion system gatekeeper subunit SctW [Geminicoccaceae bacterium]